MLPALSCKCSPGAANHLISSPIMDDPCRMVALCSIDTVSPRRSLLTAGGKQCACRPLHLLQLGSSSADVGEVGRWPPWWKLRLRPCPSATPCAPSWTASTSRQAWLPCPMPELPFSPADMPAPTPLTLSLSVSLSLFLSLSLFCGVLLCPFHVEASSAANFMSRLCLRLSLLVPAYPLTGLCSRTTHNPARKYIRCYMSAVTSPESPSLCLLGGTACTVMAH